jgi:tetratricopeptide (TPR) repeat protein
VSDDVRPKSIRHAPEGLPGALGDDFDVDVFDSFSAIHRSAPSAVADSPARPFVRRLPSLPAASAAPAPLSAEQVSTLRARAQTLASEARAAARPAPLWFAAGCIHEFDLDDTRAAAACYEAAYRADPAFLPVLRAARAMFSKLGLWRAVTLLLDAEIRASDGPVVELRMEKARLLQRLPGREGAALLEYRAVLAEHAAHTGAVDAVVRTLGVQGRHDEIVDVLVAAADAAPRDALKSAWLIQAGQLCETRLGDDERATVLLERAAALLPGRRPLLETLRRLYARRGATTHLADVLEQLASTAAHDSEAVAWWHERARELWSSASAGDDERAAQEALAALEKARSRAPTDPGILDELGRLYERLQQWPALADVLEARADVVQDVRMRAFLLGDAARIAEERLVDPERAIRLYRRSAEVAPENAEALASLGRLFARTRRFEDLSVVYDQQILALTEPHEKVPLLFKQAELLAFTLDDPSGALARLRDLLDVVPGDVAAVRMSATLCMRLGRYAELIEIWEAQLADERSPLDAASRLYLLQKMAGVYEDHLGDPTTAAATYERMLQVEPAHLPAMRGLARLYSALSRWEDVLRVHAAEADVVGDPSVVVSLWFRSGEVLADKLGRVDDAIQAFRRALTFDPTCLPALKALGAIYARSERWRDLVDMHRQEAHVTRSRAQRSHLLYQVAQLTLEHLHDVDGAVATLHELLALDPAHLASLPMLEKIARQRGDAQGVLAAQDRALAVTPDALARAALRCRIAEHLEVALGRTDNAVAALEAALVDDPTMLPAHEQLITLLSRHGRTDAEAAARERVHDRLPDEPARLANLRSLLSLYQHHLDDVARAAMTARRILSLAPGDRTALRSLLNCALRNDDIAAAIDAAEKLSAVEPSAEEVVNLHVQLATWREHGLSPPGDPLSDWLRVLEFQPDHPTAVAAVEQRYIQAGAWESLFALYEQVASTLTDPRWIVDNAMKRGHLAEERLGRLDVARTCYEQALGAVRDHLPAIARLRDLYGREGRPEDQLRLATLEAEMSSDPGHAIDTLLAVGAEQRDRFGDIDAAADCFGRVLARDPAHTKAYAALEALWTTHGRLAALAELYERRADVLDDAPQNVDERVSLLLRAAQIQHEGLGRVDVAAQLLERVRTLSPGDPAALSALGLARGALGEWDAAVDAFETALVQCTDPIEGARIHLHLGTIFVGPRLNASRATTHLQATLAAQPGYRPAQSLLARSYELAGSPQQSLATWRELLPGARNDAERRGLQLTMARLAEVSGDHGRAATLVEAAVGLTAAGEEARALFERATGLFERAGDVAGLVAATLRRADAVVDVDRAYAATLLLRAARLLVERTRDMNAGLKAARRARELAPDDVDVCLFLAELLGTLPNQQMLAIEEHRRLLRAGHVRVASLRGLYRAWTQQRALDRCTCVVEALAFLSAVDEADERFLLEQKKHLKKDSREQLAPGEVTSWLAHPAQRNAARDVLAAASADLGRLFAVEPPETLEKRFILKHRTDDPLRTLADNLAYTLGVTGFDVWRSQAPHAKVELYPDATSVLWVGRDVTRTHQLREQRFLLGRRLMALQSGHHLLRGRNARGLALLLSAIGRSQDKTFPVLVDVDVAEAEALAKKVGGALSRRARGQLEGPLGELATASRTLDLNAFLQAAPLSENRAGLLLAGAIDVAVRLVARDHGTRLAGNTASLLQTIGATPALADLFAFVVSDEFFQARQALKLAIDR